MIGCWDWPGLTMHTVVGGADLASIADTMRGNKIFVKLWFNLIVVWYNDPNLQIEMWSQTNIVST